MSAERRPIHADRQAAAAYWFSRKRSGDMTADDLRAFEIWLVNERGAKAALEDMERIWSVAGDVQEDPAILDVREQEATGLRQRARWQAMGAIAASCAVIAGGAWLLSENGFLPEWMQTPAPQEFHTTVGQRATITLADQSVVMLDTDTALRVRITNGERRVELERGQASFHVAKERYRPFIVAAAGKTVRATGTAFDVRVENHRFEVTLIEGRVRVQERGVAREEGPVADMRPGWRLAVGDDKRWRMEPVDLGKATSWHDGVLTFYYDPIIDAAAEMNRYSQRKIVFKGKPPGKRVLGNFRAGDVESFARALELNKLARIASMNEDQIEISAR